jgi:hypothetical protein
VQNKCQGHGKDEMAEQADTSVQGQTSLKPSADCCCWMRNMEAVVTPIKAKMSHFPVALSQEQLSGGQSMPASPSLTNASTRKLSV